MAKCELPKGLLSISGTMGNLVFKTYHRPDGTTVTRAYPKPRYERRTPISANERAARSNFSRMAQEVAQRIRNGDHRPKSLIWAEVKSQFLTAEAMIGESTSTNTVEASRVPKEQRSHGVPANLGE